MHPIRRRLAVVSNPALVVAMVAALLAAVAPAAGAEQAAGTTRSIRTITRGASLSFPTTSSVGTVQGVHSPEIRKSPEEGESGEDAAASLRAAAAADLSIPVVKPTRVAGSRPGLRRSFEGLNHFDQRTANNGNQFSIEPPDQSLCVGNGFVLESTNTVLRVFDERGRARSAVTDLNSFYGYPAAINRTTGAFGPFIADPTCLFDKDTNRWFHVVLTFEVDPANGAFLGPNHLDVAVSKTSSPLGGWNVYRIAAQNDGTQGTPSHESCPCIGDYPHVGADKFGFYVTSNEYPFAGEGEFGNGFNGAQIYALSKRALARGDETVSIVHFENTVLSDGRTPGFTTWPAQFNPGEFATRDNGTEYFLSSSAASETLNEEGMDNRIGLWRLTNSASLDSASPAPELASDVLASQTYGVPLGAEQKLGSVPLRDCIMTTCLAGVGPPVAPEVEQQLDSLDSRMQQTWFADGRLYGALSTIANVGGDIETAVAWFVVDPGGRGRGPRIANQGYLGVAGANLTMPAVAVLPSGKGALAFTLSGASHFPSAAYARVRDGRVSAEVNVAGRGAGPQDGFCGYAFFNCGATDPPSNRPRWGDYGAAVTQGDAVWIASEWVGQTCTFATYLQDQTCGGTRTALANWSTRVSLVRP